jgi:hypothetical protein
MGTDRDSALFREALHKMLQRRLDDDEKTLM